MTNTTNLVWNEHADSNFVDIWKEKNKQSPKTGNILFPEKFYFMFVALKISQWNKKLHEENKIPYEKITGEKR